MQNMLEEETVITLKLGHFEIKAILAALKVYERFVECRMNPTFTPQEGKLDVNREILGSISSVRGKLERVLGINKS